MFSMKCASITANKQGRRGYAKGFASFCLEAYKKEIVSAFNGVGGLDANLSFGNGKSERLGDVLAHLLAFLSPNSIELRFVFDGKRLPDGENPDEVFRDAMFAYGNGTQCWKLQSASRRFRERYALIRSDYIRRVMSNRRWKPKLSISEAFVNPVERKGGE